MAKIWEFIKKNKVTIFVLIIMVLAIMNLKSCLDRKNSDRILGKELKRLQKINHKNDNEFNKLLANVRKQNKQMHKNIAEKDSEIILLKETQIRNEVEISNIKTKTTKQLRKEKANLNQVLENSEKQETKIKWLFAEIENRDGIIYRLELNLKTRIKIIDNKNTIIAKMTANYNDLKTEINLLRNVKIKKENWFYLGIGGMFTNEGKFAYGISAGFNLRKIF